MKILITGATGFVGSKVLKKLLEQYNINEVIVLASKEIENVKTLLHNGYNFDENFFIQNNCEDIEILIHIGAYTPKSGREANLITENNSNIINTQKILDSKMLNLKKIIFISTLDVYSPAEITKESTITDPVSLYGWSKLYCEKMIEIFAKEKGIIFQILRLGHVFGPGEENYRKILPITIRKVICNDEVEIWGGGDVIRSFIYIDDVATAIVNSIKLNTSNLINIVGEEQITINDLVKKIIGISKKDIKIKHISTDSPNRNLIFDASKLKQTLLSKFTTLEEGLIREYNYMENL